MSKNFTNFMNDHLLYPWKEKKLPMNSAVIQNTRCHPLNICNFHWEPFSYMIIKVISINIVNNYDKLISACIAHN